MPVYHQKGSYIFKGDRHNDFSGDPVCVLSDGSAWKIHPEDVEMYNLWSPDDGIHVQVRTSFFWFKREHKFELQNSSRDESVRVMLVQYPSDPLTINDVKNIKKPRLLTTSYKIDGEVYESSRWVRVWKTLIYLSDGTTWIIDGGNRTHFKTGDFVYLGQHTQSPQLSYFFIVGDEREAVWTTTTRDE